MSRGRRPRNSLLAICTDNFGLKSYFGPFYGADDLSVRAQVREGFDGTIDVVEMKSLQGEPDPEP